MTALASRMAENRALKKGNKFMSRKTLYLEGASGISGDMTVAALLDLGANREKLLAALNSLGVEGYEVVIEKKNSYGLAGLDFDVRLHSESNDEGIHAHDHHKHRHLADIEEIIDRGELTEGARALAKKIFRIVAEAESEAHGCSVQSVHFHEVGAVDSIVDIVATAVCWDDLQLDECIVTGLHEGCGFVQCQHGLLPVPVPAVVNIARAHGITLRPTANKGELVTPTGIAIAAALRTKTALPSEFQVDKIGIGLGKRDIGRANMLRAMILREDETAERVFVLESNIDDSTGEALGYVMAALFDAGARDVHFVPCFMKKNRPGWLLRILADEETIPALEKIVFRETTSIGLRRWEASRSCMAREQIAVQLRSNGQTVTVKRCQMGDIVKNYPEYESVRAVALLTGQPFHEVYREAQMIVDEDRKSD
ncbi:MAG: nickel pincer cofactor biosynthesis protein LarC [Myxococcaceae bacterium]|nr:nickel pincer cofactor biosynthesis protein LarC [Myxococcaceae bacterium]